MVYRSRSIRLAVGRRDARGTQGYCITNRLVGLQAGTSTRSAVNAGEHEQRILARAISRSALWVKVALPTFTQRRGHEELSSSRRIEPIRHGCAIRALQRARSRCRHRIARHSAKKSAVPSPLFALDQSIMTMV